MKKIKEFINKRTTQTKILSVIIISIILFASYALYVKYNFGEIDILVPYNNSSIFLDSKKIDTTNYDDQTIILRKLNPGRHSVVVYTENRYPWQKTLSIKKNTSTKIHPFLILSTITKDSYGVIMEFTNKDTKKINALFKKQSNNKSSYISNNIEIKKEDNNILATWLGDKALTPKLFCDNNNECKKTITVFTSKKDPIKTIRFYPNRNDIIIFSTDKNIYAIEIDKTGIQNFQPIYNGDNPNFTIDKKNSTLYIKDGNLMFGIVLDR